MKKSSSSAFYFMFVLLIGAAHVVEGGREVESDAQESTSEQSPRKRRFDSESFERHVFGRELSSVERRYGGILGLNGGGGGGGIDGPPPMPPPPFYGNQKRWNNNGCCYYNNGYRYRYNYEWQQWGKK
uniref:Uncharacterized protein n=1 Tax=Plectus sambesii TaxID=2011161 RepID=A0A914W315_9BILA